MDRVGRKITWESVEKGDFEVGVVVGVGVGGGVVFRSVGKWVRCGGWLGGGVIGFGWGIDDMEIYRLITPEGGCDHISVRYVEFREMLKVIVPGKGWVDYYSDATMCVVRW